MRREEVTSDSPQSWAAASMNESDNAVLPQYQNNVEYADNQTMATYANTRNMSQNKGGYISFRRATITG